VNLFLSSYCNNVFSLIFAVKSSISFSFWRLVFWRFWFSERRLVFTWFNSRIFLFSCSIYVSYTILSASNSVYRFFITFSSLNYSRSTCGYTYFLLLLFNSRVNFCIYKFNVFISFLFTALIFYNSVSIVKYFFLHKSISD
jgi:hypothetical protein